MDITAILRKDGNHGAGRVAEYVGRHPEHLPVLLADVQSPAKRVKNAAAKAVRVLSETHPALLQPHWSEFTTLMRSPDTIVKWIAIDVCGNLARVNPDVAVETGTVRKLAALLAADSLVTASHAADTLGKIAEGHATHRSRITTALAGVGEIPRRADCRNILIGRAIQAYGRYWPEVGRAQQAKIRVVAERHTRNPLAATRKKAEGLLRKMK